MKNNIDWDTFRKWYVIFLLSYYLLSQSKETYENGRSYKKLALTTCNDNKTYYQWIPHCIKFWKKLNFDFVVYFFADELPSELEEYSEHIILWKPPTNLYTPSVCQISRLYLPMLHKNYDMVLITDVDLVPLSPLYFSMVDTFSKDKFVAMRKKEDEYYMPFNVASPEMWNKLTKVNPTKKSINEKLKQIFEKYKTSNDTPRKVSWGLDQDLLRIYIDRLNEDEKQIITNVDSYYILHSNWEFKKAFFNDKNKKIDPNKIGTSKDNFIFFTRDDERKTINLQKELDYLASLYKINYK